MRLFLFGVLSILSISSHALLVAPEPEVADVSAAEWDKETLEFGKQFEAIVRIKLTNVVSKETMIASGVYVGRSSKNSPRGKVLTAAHSFQKLDLLGEDARGKIEMAFFLESSNEPIFIQGASVAIHPEFDPKDVISVDLAEVFFDLPKDFPITPMEVATSSDIDGGEHEFLVGGFGKFAVAGQKDWNLDYKRRAAFTKAQLRSRTLGGLLAFEAKLQIHKSERPKNLADKPFNISGRKGLLLEGLIAHGDSGGPLFFKDCKNFEKDQTCRWLVAGIASRSYGPTSQNQLAYYWIAVPGEI